MLGLSHAKEKPAGASFTWKGMFVQKTVHAGCRLLRSRHPLGLGTHPSGEGRRLHLHTDTSSCPLTLTLASHTCSLQGTRIPTWASTSQVRMDATYRLQREGAAQLCRRCPARRGPASLLDPLGLLHGHTVPLSNVHEITSPFGTVKALAFSRGALRIGPVPGLQPQSFSPGFEGRL